VVASSPRARLDELVVQRGLASTRSAARGLIMAGLVLVEGQVSDKAGTPIAADATITLKQRPRFVSRGGEKLAHALEVFQVDVAGKDALDVGASTGGFVDCLLQAGAARVVALDVGRGQLDNRLRNDERVSVLEKVNARHLEADTLPFVPEILTMDVSFISVEKVLPAVMASMSPFCCGVILIKPQFEAGPKQVGRGGIVKDPEVHREVLLRLARFVISGLEAELRGITDSGLPGTDGNVEYFFHIGRGGEKGHGLDTLETLVDATVARVMNVPTTDKD
jgi:23S rRNA (cytidine1920-2'-O)/16S rRNA (cytidine1409-2'-O)-methyltransferase